MQTKKLLLRLTTAALFLAPAAALAQNAFPTPTSGVNANGVVVMCIDGGGHAIPALIGGTCLGAGGGSVSVTVAPLTSTNAAGSIAVTSTFQSIQVSTAGRNGCLIQNQSTTNPMWVYFGAIGGATKAKSFLLDSTHGLAISCSVGGLGVLTDQVSITGTAADLYNANFQ
jgi:hypothetical protein